MFTEKSVKGFDKFEAVKGQALYCKSPILNCIAYPSAPKVSQLQRASTFALGFCFCSDIVIYCFLPSILSDSPTPLNLRLSPPLVLS